MCVCFVCLRSMYDVVADCIRWSIGLYCPLQIDSNPLEHTCKLIEILQISEAHLNTDIHRDTFTR